MFFICSKQYNTFLGSTFTQIAGIFQQLMDGYWQDYCKNNKQEDKKQAKLMKNQLIKALNSAINFLNAEDRKKTRKLLEKVKKTRFIKNKPQNQTTGFILKIK